MHRTEQILSHEDGIPGGWDSDAVQKSWHRLKAMSGSLADPISQAELKDQIRIRFDGDRVTKLPESNEPQLALQLAIDRIKWEFRTNYY